jgi:hypothetical protein
VREHAGPLAERLAHLEGRRRAGALSKRHRPSCPGTPEDTQPLVEASVGKARAGAAVCTAACPSEPLGERWGAHRCCTVQARQCRWRLEARGSAVEARNRSGGTLQFVPSRHARGIGAPWVRFRFPCDGAARRRLLPRDRSRKDGRAPHCKACVRRWRRENAEHLADYHRRWQQANRDRKRAQGRRYRERTREDPEYRERRRRPAA